MSVRVKLYNKDVNEEEVEQNQTTDQNSNSSNTQQPATSNRNYAQEYATVTAKIAELERRFNAEKQPLLNQRTAIMQAAAKAGISLTGANESHKVSYNLSTKLYESMMSTGKTDELVNIINSTFDALPDLSYYMDSKGCKSLAKRMLAFLNDQYWNDGQNHWSDVAEFIRNTIGRANISLSTKEVKKFVDELSNQMNGNSMFIWIFGNKTPEPVEEEPVEEVPAETETPNLITPEDEEELLGFAEPVEEEPVIEYPEESEVPVESVVITPDDEEELIQYAEPYEEETDELYEGKHFNQIRNIFKKQDREYNPTIFTEEPELPDVLELALHQYAEEIASDLIYEIENNGKDLYNEVYEFLLYAGDQFWDEYYLMMGEKEHEYYTYFLKFTQEEELQKIMEVWGDQIVEVFQESCDRYKREHDD